MLNKNVAHFNFKINKIKKGQSVIRVFLNLKNKLLTIKVMKANFL